MPAIELQQAIWFVESTWAQLKPETPEKSYIMS